MRIKVISIKSTCKIKREAGIHDRSLDVISKCNYSNFVLHLESIAIIPCQMYRARPVGSSVQSD